MKNTIRIAAALVILSFVAACADKKEQPPVRATGGKTYVPVAR